MTAVQFLTLYKFVCFSTAVSLIIYWVYAYYLDDDLCVVDYKKYLDDESDTFPTLSICLENSILESKLWEQNPQINASSYLKFLKGEYYDADMIKVDYRNVTLDINKFIDIEYISYRNGSYFSYPYHKTSKPIFSVTYTGIFFQGFYNCYTVQMPKDGDAKTYQPKF